MDQKAEWTVDPALIQWAALLVYWAIVGLTFVVGWVDEGSAILLALAPLLLLAVEGLLTAIANRVTR